MKLFGIKNIIFYDFSMKPKNNLKYIFIINLLKVEYLNMMADYPLSMGIHYLYYHF